MNREERAGPRSGLFLLALVIALSFLTVQGAKADVLTPGQYVPNAGDPFGFDPNTTTIVASTGLQNFSVENAQNQVVDTGYYQIWAVTDPSNGFCANCIDIMAQIAVVSSVDGIDALSMGSFSGFSVDAGYFPGWWMTAIADATNPTFSPEVSAVSVQRSGGTGSTVTFEYGAPIIAGEDSDEFAIMTNATSYTGGSLNLQDNGVTTVIGYAPAVPEPSTAGLLGFGLLALPFLRRKLFG